ncbi:MAG: ABC transporter ATP-binding protein [Deltaproteobacteria bacterium]|nr:ABC transporter ATP-binding protein [Deltaproteobacteria bacterium]
MLVLRNITKTFNPSGPGRCTALKDLDLSIPLGRVSVITGPSGSGKTTLLSLVGCLLRPTSGRIFLGEMEITGLPERFMSLVRRDRFGFVFQHFNLIRGVSAVENVMLPGYPTGIPRSKLLAKAEGLLSGLGIAAKSKVRVERLSGGEQQRVAIARALINDPDIILADEPSAHLDTEMAADFMETAGSLAEEGITVLISTHDPVLYQSPCVDRVIRLRNGELLGDQ